MEDCEKDRNQEPRSFFTATKRDWEPQKVRGGAPFGWQKPKRERGDKKTLVEGRETAKNGMVLSVFCFTQDTVRGANFGALVGISQRMLRQRWSNVAPTLLQRCDSPLRRFFLTHTNHGYTFAKISVTVERVFWLILHGGTPFSKPVKFGATNFHRYGRQLVRTSSDSCFASGGLATK